MKSGSIIPFMLLVIGYIGFELYVASQNTYRMEPEHIYGEYVAASQAIGQCGPLKSVDTARFDANLRYSRRRAMAAIAEDQAGESPAAIEALVRDQELAGRQQVDVLVSERGCDDIELFKLRKRYENLARRNLPTQESDWSG